MFPVEALRDAVRANRFSIRTHARQRMVERGIALRDVKRVLLSGDLLEEYPSARPFPKALFMGFVGEGEPLYISCAFDGERAYIVTVHWYDPERWIDPWTRRRS